MSFVEYCKCFFTWKLSSFWSKHHKISNLDSLRPPFPICCGKSLLQTQLNIWTSRGKLKTDGITVFRSKKYLPDAQALTVFYGGCILFCSSLNFSVSLQFIQGISSTMGPTDPIHNDEVCLLWKNTGGSVQIRRAKTTVWMQQVRTVDGHLLSWLHWCVLSSGQNQSNSDQNEIHICLALLPTCQKWGFLIKVYYFKLKKIDWGEFLL